MGIKKKYTVTTVKQKRSKTLDFLKMLYLLFFLFFSNGSYSLIIINIILFNHIFISLFFLFLC